MRANTVKDGEWEPQTINPHCSTQDFRSDLSELCSSCKLTQFIREKIETQIVFQANQQKEILTPAQFTEYCNDEIKSGREMMREMDLNMKRHEADKKYCANIPNTTEVYIWNKERIKALNLIQSSILSSPTPNDNNEKAKPEKPSRNEDTHRKARQAVTLFESQIETLVQQEKGKLRPKQEKEIVEEAIRRYSHIAVGQNLGKDPKSLNRYLEDIGKQMTALKYGRQLVGQFKQRK